MVSGNGTILASWQAYLGNPFEEYVWWGCCCYWWWNQRCSCTARVRHWTCHGHCRNRGLSLVIIGLPWWIVVLMWQSTVLFLCSWLIESCLRRTNVIFCSRLLVILCFAQFFYISFPSCTSSPPLLFRVVLKNMCDWLLNNSVILSIKEAVDNQNLSIDVFRDISSSSYLLYLVNVPHVCYMLFYLVIQLFPKNQAFFLNNVS